MISFIIIGRNEGWKLGRCISGVKELISFNNLEEFEILYIDSDSNDDSIEIARSGGVDKIIKIRGQVNSAIARNTGANAASGEILFFLDGDIQICRFDLKSIAFDEANLRFPYVVGFLDDVNYTAGWQLINRVPRGYREPRKDQLETTVGGGIFITRRDTWSLFKGMDERLRRTQDRDLSLRMAKKGITGIRKTEVFGLHHTIPYRDRKRMWTMIRNGSVLYKGVFLRKQLLNIHFLPKLIREEWTLITLLLSILLTMVSPLFIFIYPLAALFKVRKHLASAPLTLVTRILLDLLVILSALFFYPLKPEYTLEVIQ